MLAIWGTRKGPDTLGIPPKVKEDPFSTENYCPIPPLDWVFAFLAVAGTTAQGHRAVGKSERPLMTNDWQN